MLPNGLIQILDLALSDNITLTPVGRKSYALLVLGLFREDCFVLPVLQKAMPSLSLGHIWPLSRIRFRYLYRKALGFAKNGERERSLVFLGRALHVLADMACPAHVTAKWHYLHDPFERAVESQRNEFSQDDVTLVESLTTMTTDFVAALASQTRQIGKTASVAEQVRRLIPLAAAHARRLFADYSLQTGGDWEKGFCHA